MMRALALLFALICAPQPAWVQSFDCVGVLPSWTLELGPDAGTLRTDQVIPMPVLDLTLAEGRDWPKAFTLVGDRDTAIVVIERAMCHVNDIELDHRVNVLTQRGTTPILLAGCCEARE